MIRFFRVLRQRLLAENRVSRYLLYALGEIALVMVGILLALQVNNWNEARKDRAFLDFSLQEIHSDLKSDLRIIYKGIEPRLKRRELGAKRLYQMMLENQPPEDSLFLAAYENMKMSFLLTSSTQAYESLKARGLDIIPNKDLQYTLFNFYEISLPRGHTFISGDDQNIKERTAQLEETVFRLEVRESEQGQPVHVKVPRSTDLANLQALHRILEMNSADTSDKRFRLNNLKRQYFTILDILEGEMSRRTLPFIPFDSTAIQPDF